MLNRRRFLASVGIGLVGTATLGAAFFGSAQDADGAIPTDQWLFGRYVKGCTDVQFDDSTLTTVTLPHCVAPLSWTGWQPSSWESLWVYRQYFDTTPGLRRGRAFLTFDGVLSAATVFLNGKLLGTHLGGYLPFEFELTDKLDPQSNVIAVVVDGRWNQNVPPNLMSVAKPSTIDFYQPAGIYRGAAVTAGPKARLADVFACPLDVLTPDRRLDLTATVNSAGTTRGPVRLEATLSQHGMQVASEWTELDKLGPGDNTMALTMTGLDAVQLWDVDDPKLCEVRVTLWVGDKQTDQTSVRVGFRDARFTADGFFLNGRRVKLFGLNRHQWYPYVGGAMPDRVQRTDAELLKNELNCNMVRCSHYPQSTAFLDACDELGLLVWEEVPGWDYVGDEVWQQRVVDDVRGMVTRDRNHPSIIVWGTRINETLGQTELYNQTDALARQLDGSRPTTGAVKGTLGYSERLYADGGSDAPAVFAFNDYSRPKPPELAALRPPRPEVAYLVSEAIGTLVGPPSFRRTDPVPIQQEQAVLHATVHNQAAGDDRYCGLLGWCAFDYPSGWYHSVDGVKYPGVADIFRIPKLGAAFYRSQADPAKRVVVEPAFYWDFSPKSPKNGPGSRALIWSNCDRIDVYLDNVKHASVTPDRAAFPHLDHPPFAVNLTLPAGRRPELRLDGFLGGKLALSRKFSPDPKFDTLSCVADDTTLNADGSDTTRIVVRVVDRYGAPRPYVQGTVRFAVSGPGTLIGDNPLDLGRTGGAAAVWLRTQRATRGTITVSVSHPTAGTAAAQITAG